MAEPQCVITIAETSEKWGCDSAGGAIYRPMMKGQWCKIVGGDNTPPFRSAQAFLRYIQRSYGETGRLRYSSGFHR